MIFWNAILRETYRMYPKRMLEIQIGKKLEESRPQLFRSIFLGQLRAQK
jgi:hypothetical protein